MQWHLNFEMAGTYVMLPWSWLTSVNACLTLYFIKVYRRYVLSLFGCGKAIYRLDSTEPKPNMGSLTKIDVSAVA